MSRDGSGREAGTSDGAARAAREAIVAAKEQLSDLTGQVAESVSAVRRTDHGWKLAVEVVEARRVPDTTSLLASYEVVLNRDGELLEYARTHRYVRSQAGEMEA